ncbi:MAG: recombinase family protein, partial [Microcoleus sp. SIO2G3]|nr:recombinase family protein [Microcoleus sp. SIO2G3]
SQHYWEVDDRLHHYSRARPPIAISVGHFIRLLRDGTLTADPFPARRLDNRSAVTIATIYQYRTSRQQHRWHFWLDVGSAFWLTGGGALFGAPLFLRSWSGRPWTAANSLQADQQRLQRQVSDLLSRVSDRVYLCHSELATNGQEQSGPLLSLANAATLLEAVEF